MSAPVSAIFVALKGQAAQFNSTMQQAAKTLRGLGEVAEHIGKRFSLGLTLPLAEAAKVAIESATQMQEAFFQLTRSTGLVGENLDSLKNSFSRVFTGVPESAGKVAGVLTMLERRLKLTGQPLEELSTLVLDLARITGEDLTSVLQGSTGVLANWGVSAEHAGEVLNFLYGASQKSGVGISALTDTLASLGTQFRAAGFTLEETASIVAQMGQIGIPVESSARALNKFIATIAKAGGDVPAAFNSIISGIKGAHSQTEALKIAAIAFGPAASKMAEAIRRGAFDVAGFTKTVKESSPEIHEMAEKTEGFLEILGKFKNQLVAAFAPLADALTKLLSDNKEGLSSFAEGIRSLGEWFAKLSPPIQETIVGVLGFIAAAGPLGFVLAPLFETLGGLFHLFSELPGAVGLLFTPMGALVAVVTAATVVWFKYGDQIKSFVLPILEGLWNNFKQGLAILEDWASQAGELLGRVVGKFEDMAEGVGRAVQALYNSVKTWLVDKLQALVAPIEKFARRVKGLFVDLKDDVAKTAADVGGAVQEKAGAALGATGDYLGGLWSKALNSVSDETKAAVRKIGEAAAELPKKLQKPAEESKASVHSVGETMHEVAEGTKKSVMSLSQVLGLLGGEGKKSAAEAKKLASELEQSIRDIQLAARQADPAIEKLAHELATLIEKKDIQQLENLARQYSKTKQGADDFRLALERAKQIKQEDVQTNKELATSIEEVDKFLGKVSGHASDAGDEIAKLILAGKVDKIREMGEAFVGDAEKMKEFTDRVREGIRVAEEMQHAYEEFASSVADSISNLVSKAGTGISGLSSLLKNFITGAITGVSGTQGGFGGKAGSWLAEALGLTNTDALAGQFGDGVKGALGQFDSITQEFGLTESSRDGWFASITGLDTSSVASMQSGLMGLAGTLTNVLDAFQKFGHGAKKNIEAAGESLGTVVGAIFGGPEGAAAGGTIGDLVGQGLGSLFGVGHKRADTKGRNTVVDYINGLLSQNKPTIGGQQLTGLANSGGQQFAMPGWMSSFSQFGDKAQKVFTGLGDALTKLLGVTEDVGKQIGLILAQNLSGNIDDARLLVHQLGLNFFDLQDALVAAAVKGDISWKEFEADMQGVAEAFKPGLVAIGDMTGAVDQLIASGGRGEQAVQALRNLAVEATEAGVKNLDGLRQHLVASGKYTTEQIEQIFTALHNRGITNLDQLKDVSDRIGGGVVADLANMGFQFAEVADSVQQTADSLNQIPDNTEKNLTINVNVSGDDQALKALDMVDGGGSSGSSRGRAALPLRAKSLSTGSSGEQPDQYELAGILPPSGSSHRREHHSSRRKSASINDQQKAMLAALKTAQEAASAALGVPFGFGVGGASTGGDLKAFNSFMSGVNTRVSTFAADTKTAFGVLGEAVRNFLNITEKVGPQIGSILASNLNGNLDAARHLVAGLGIDYQKAEDAIVKAADQGTISWAQMEDQIRKLQSLFAPGIAALGDYAGAIRNLVSSGGKGFDAVQSIRDLAVEGLEAGASSLEDLKKRLSDTGQFTAASLDALFNAIAGRGFQTLADLAQASDRVAGGVVADAAAGGFNFYTPPAAPAAAPKASRRPAPRIRRPHALGGIATGPMAVGALDMIAERGPEVILPLDQLPRFGVGPRVNGGAGGNQISYHIDARGAAPGVGQEIRRALETMRDSIVREATQAVYRERRRGGSYSRSFGI